MKATLSEVVMREQLREMGFSPAKVDAAIARELGAASATQPAITYVQFIGPMLPFPIRVTLPWSLLVSDNKRKRPTVKRSKTGQIVPQMALTEEYKIAATKTRSIAKAAMTVEGKTCVPLEQDLQLIARVYTPSGRRCDIVNFAKGVHDALSGIVYRDDLQLRDVRWLHAGQDTDAPRAELEIRPL